MSLVGTLVAAALGLGVLAALTGATATGGRALAGAGARAEAEDTLTAAEEALAFDVRRAGWDPGAAGIDVLVEARADRVVVAADLDGDGAVDATSEERVTWACLTGPARLQRIVGTQSLPVAQPVAPCGFAYRDAAGTPIDVPPGGLSAAARASVRAVVLDVGLAPPGLHAPAVRRVIVALRSAP